MFHKRNKVNQIHTIICITQGDFLTLSNFDTKVNTEKLILDPGS